MVVAGSRWVPRRGLERLILRRGVALSWSLRIAAEVPRSLLFLFRIAADVPRPWSVLESRCMRLASCGLLMDRAFCLR